MRRDSTSASRCPGVPRRLQDMLADMAHGGKIAMLGLPSENFGIDWSHLVMNMITIKGIYGRQMFETWYWMSVLVQSGRRHLAGDHAPLRGHRLRGGLRGHAHRPIAARSCSPGPKPDRRSAMFTQVRAELSAQLDEIRAEGLFKPERVIVTPQQATSRCRAAPRSSTSAPTTTSASPTTLVLVAAAKQALDRWGYGMASVRFICGTQQIHKDLERRLSDFLRTEDSILYSSCFDANGGLVRDALGQGRRRHLRRAEPRLDHRRHPALRRGRATATATGTWRTSRSSCGGLRRASAADRHRRRVLDGRLRGALGEICELADRYGAMVMVDDSHAVGFVGAHGPRHAGAARGPDRVDIVTGTLGKALGGASGGYVSGRQRDHRPPTAALSAVPVLQLVAPGDRGRVAGVLDLLDESDDLRAG